MANMGRVRAGLPPVTLVLGGARSGKSRHAERLVEAAADGGIYCATAEAGDAEMAARIAAHRARRGPFWRTVEEPLALAAVIAAEARGGRPLLVDCLTLWLSNVMLARRAVEEEAGALCAALRHTGGPVVLVANEVGMGLVPETPLGRGFRDAAGRLNQDVAALADRVVFVAAGLPLVLKDVNHRLSRENPSPPLRGEREGPAPQAWEGEVGIFPAPKVPRLTPALSTLRGREGEGREG
jgi:adenosylcobinamide kinase / adenosylcobinamide-phosphate guanylyltransferase